MARLWYHGDRNVHRWMQGAQDQLGSEEATAYTETERSSFIGLATGNAHTHPNYVLRRELASFPFPVHLRKDPRLGFHKEAHTALLAHADPSTLAGDELTVKEGAKVGRPSACPSHRPNGDAGRAGGLVDALDPSPRWSRPPAEAVLSLSPEVRLSLEVVDDRVAMVLTTPRVSGGCCRPRNRTSCGWSPTHPRSASWELADVDGNGLTGYVSELVGAGVLVDAPAVIIKMKPEAGRDEIDYVSRRARSLGFQVHESVDSGQVLLSLQGPMEAVTPEALAGIRGVEAVLPTRSSYRLASIDYRQERRWSRWAASRSAASGWR